MITGDRLEPREHLAGRDRVRDSPQGNDGASKAGESSGHASMLALVTAPVQGPNITLPGFQLTLACWRHVLLSGTTSPPTNGTDPGQRVGCANGVLAQPQYHQLLEAASFTRVNITSTHSAEPDLANELLARCPTPGAPSEIGSERGHLLDRTGTGMHH